MRAHQKGKRRRTLTDKQGDHESLSLSLSPVFSVGLCVSSTASLSPPLCDVVSHGQVIAPWSTPGIILPAVSQPAFFLSMASQSSALQIQLTYAAIGDPSIAVADWSIGSESALLTSGTSTFANGTLQCFTSGWSNFSLLLSFPSSPSGPLKLTFGKQCSQPVFDIGTQSASDSNAMESNVPLMSFESYDFTESTPILFFKVSLSQQQQDPSIQKQPFTLLVESDQPNALVIVSTSSGGWNGIAQPRTVAMPSVNTGTG
jgi:hypothetical protein